MGGWGRAQAPGKKKGGGPTLPRSQLSCRLRPSPGSLEPARGLPPHASHHHPHPRQRWGKNHSAALPHPKNP